MLSCSRSLARISYRAMSEFARSISSSRSVSPRGVPGIEPCDEFVRLMGGVNMRRPNLSNLAGEAVRDIREDEDGIRWWLRWPGRTGVNSCGFGVWLADDATGGVAPSDLLALTRATAALGSWAAFRSLRSASICASCMLSIFSVAVQIDMQGWEIR